MPSTRNAGQDRNDRPTCHAAANPQDASQLRGIAFVTTILITVSIASAGIGGRFIPNPNAGPSPREQAAKAVAATIDTARHQLARLHAQLVQQLAADPDLFKARLAASDTSAKYAAIRNNAIARLNATAAGQQRAAKVRSLEHQLDSANNAAAKQGTLVNTDVLRLAASLLIARGEQTKAESDFLAHDETVMRAFYAQIDAAARLEEAEEQTPVKVRCNAEWLSARLNLEAAQRQMALLTD